MARLIDADFLEQEISKWIKYFGAGEYYCGYDDALTAVQDLVADMPTITPQSEWVSVEDRLPDTAGEFLVVYHPCYGDKVTSEIRVGIDSFRGKTAWAKRKYQRVTHWMPLPKPPKEELLCKN